MLHPTLRSPAAMFELDPRLSADTIPVCDLGLSAVRLMDDADVPWLVLVPQRSGLRELFDLPPADRQRLMEEIAVVGRVLQRRFTPDKLNVGALGNLVAQLHVHVVARRRGDRAWPGPIWGSPRSSAYGPERAGALVAQLAVALEREAGADAVR